MTGLLAMVVLAQAQSCIAQPIVQPQYQVQFATQAYGRQAVYNEALTWVAVEQIQTPPEYYGGLVAQQQRTAERQAQAQQATASTDARIEQLARVIEALQKRIEASEPPIPSHPGQQISSPPLPSVGASAEAVPPPPTVAQASTSVAARKGNGSGFALLSAKCGACHTGASQKGRGFKIFAPDGSLVKLDQVSLDAIDAEISSGRMPKLSSNLTLREYVTVRDFLDEQASGLAILTTNPRKKR